MVETGQTQEVPVLNIDVAEAETADQEHAIDFDQGVPTPEGHADIDYTNMTPEQAVAMCGFLQEVARRKPDLANSMAQDLIEERQSASAAEQNDTRSFLDSLKEGFGTKSSKAETKDDPKATVKPVDAAEPAAPKEPDEGLGLNQARLREEISAAERALKTDEPVLAEAEAVLGPVLATEASDATEQLHDAAPVESQPVLRMVKEAGPSQDQLARQVDQEYEQHVRDVMATVEPPVEAAVATEATYTNSVTSQAESVNEQQLLEAAAWQIEQQAAAAEEHARLAEQADEADALPDILARGQTEADETSEAFSDVVELTAKREEDEHLLADVAELLESLSEDISVLQPEVIDVITEPLGEILQVTDELPEQTEAELLESGETWAIVAAEIEELFGQEEIELSEEEFVTLVDALLELKEKEPEEAELAAAPALEVDAPEPKPIEGLVLVYNALPNESVAILEQTHNKLKIMEPKAVEAAVEPVVDALQAVQEIHLAQSAEPELVLQTEEEVVAVLQAFFEQIQLDVPETDVREIVRALLQPEVLDQLLEGEGFSKLFSELGTFEGLLQSAARKMQQPFHNLLGRIPVLACLTRAEGELALAA